jgi:Vitamin K-dependent gamma-carboxylase
MTLDTSVRATEILVGLAFAQQSGEHLKSQLDTRHLFLPRLLLAILLIVGWQSTWVLLALLVLSLFILRRFDGPYNGGSDRMGLLILCCLCLVHIAPSEHWREIAFGYLALQVVLSYFISGWVKLVNPEWRNGRALCDVFQFSAYPVSESLRQWAQAPQWMLLMSWAVMLFELLLPFSLLSQPSLYIALVIGTGFHLANACLFGLNRFLWVWIAAYPALIWFQQRLPTGQ